MNSVFIVMEYRNSEENYNWGVFSTKEKAKDFLEEKGLTRDKDFEIVLYELDKGLF